MTLCIEVQKSVPAGLYTKPLFQRSTMKIIGFTWYLCLNDSSSNSAWVSGSMLFVINHSEEKQSERSPQSTDSFLEKAPWQLVTIS